MAVGDTRGARPSGPTVAGSSRAGTAIVVGAGISGLTAAVALRRRGWRVDVYERAPVLEPVGAGIALAPNAVKALDSLGMREWIDQAAVIQGSGGVRRPDGRWLVRTDLGAVAKAFGRPLVVVPRPELIDALRSQLPQAAIHLDTSVEEVLPGDETRLARVRTKQGEKSADLVVAADGIRSPIREALFPEHPGPVYAGFTAWRMIVEAGSHTKVEPSETWGRGAVFGIVPLPGGRLYCYATANLPEGTKFADEHAALLERFADWHSPIPDLIRRTPREALLRNDIYWLDKPLSAYHSGRVAFVGDAAHAMTPNLGQGGCQAIEDAVVLAHELEAEDGGGGLDVAMALNAYTVARRARTVSIARQSARAGRMQQLHAPLGTALRNGAISLAGHLGSGFMLRQMAAVAKWAPPEPPERP
ncbi:FAD-dependent monooxygenase [Actinospica robiniae]|uniref:2-polyprenyl-6-methoxyphenol hydroxylase-like oxidoreductase n=1 Tax=Actinospica robiniae DSM 44927 TaxID=479430 RepID=W9DYT9_9ACTN|nr:FAD-dependent monooxygenase [Actinospica robiniae]ETA70988.1 2-polyprenyl-6-methoxyphenol hydroxylase-like oxidoreductase [Actinospica robiniae DSM 44927]